MPQKIDEVSQILNNTHPYFIDENGKSHINYIHTSEDDARTSSVGSPNNQSYLELNVYLHNSIGDLRATAHEISHALSSHHQHRIELSRLGNASPESHKHTHRIFEQDCIGEIETI